MNYCVISPSYKRASSVRSHQHFLKDNFFYAVHEFESEKYKDRGHRVLVIPDSIRGNIARVRNWILENSPTDQIVMVDDDIDQFFWIQTRLKEREKIKKTPEEMNEIIQLGYMMAEDCGAKLWGMNCAHDPRFYTQNRPFSFSLIVLGTFSAHIRGTQRYDETLPLKEDYDFFIRSMKENRRVFRMNMMMYIADHQKMAGGCQDYRTEEDEKDNFDRLQMRWGSEIVRSGGGSDINPVIKSGI
jgi:hypothetical protein